jgi:integrase
MDLKTARQEWRAAREKVAAGRDPGAEAKAARAPQPDADRDLFVSVARLFIRRHAMKQNRSWRETARLLGFGLDDEGELIVRNGPAQEWAGKRLADVTRRDVVDLIDATQDRAPVVAKNLHANLRKLLNWSVARGVIEANPMDGMEAPPPPRARDRVLDDNELRDVWLAAGGLGVPFGPMIRLLILTGQRRDEVAGMRWSEVDLEQRMWTVAPSRMKKDRAQDVPLSEPAVEIIEGMQKLRIAGSPFVFTTTGATAPSGFSRAKTRLDAAMLLAAQKRAQEAGDDAETVEPIPAWRFHDLRRSLASGMAALGIRLEVIEKILAHESGSFGGIRGVYQRHGFSAEKRAALEAWARHVLALAEPASENILAFHREGLKKS